MFMKKTIINTSVKNVEVAKFAGDSCSQFADQVSVEEPLEIRLGWKATEQYEQIAVTMRTPGNDRELAAGFLFTEGIVHSADQIEEIVVDKCNFVTVHLRDDVQIDRSAFARHSFVASSCGVCGKKSIAAVRVKRHYECRHDTPVISARVINSLPAALRACQADFGQTGGIHASCLFSSEGKLLKLKEDVGRHNALDKLLGDEFLSGELPLTDKILMVSGRASFELVQKAAHAGLPALVAVGAPSSLAVALAEECDMTLLGFVRDDRFNVYSGLHRVKSE
jgi:FdhD protein